MNSNQKIALLKPDHLGDLILSIPAISKFISEFKNVTLLCSPYTAGLAHALWPSLETKEVNFPHLQKGNTTGAPPEASLLDEFDWVISLRKDPMVQRWLDQKSFQRTISTEFSTELHETRIQKNLLYTLVGPYSRTGHFFQRGAPEFPTDPQRIGLCISAGYSANRWPISYWKSLGELIQKDRRKVFLIGGPSERSEMQLLASWLNLSNEAIIEGSADLPAFWGRVGACCDVVIASDSGTAHLCSKVVPILSIFGPSPFRRYAPFGKHNRVITLDLTCSPCTQFDQSLVNLCLSRECIQSIQPEKVMKALFLPGPSSSVGVDRLRLGASLSLFFGVSHLPDPILPILPQGKTNKFYSLTRRYSKTAPYGPA